jgi:hypothetical protein
MILDYTCIYIERIFTKIVQFLETGNLILGFSIYFFKLLT